MEEKTQSVKNIILELPFTGKKKSIPDDRILKFENHKIIKLKLADGRDLGKVRVIVPKQNKELQSKDISKVTCELTECNSCIKKTDFNVENKLRIKTNSYNASTELKSIDLDIHFRHKKLTMLKAENQLSQSISDKFSSSTILDRNFLKNGIFIENSNLTNIFPNSSINKKRNSFMRWSSYKCKKPFLNESNTQSKVLRTSKNYKMENKKKMFLKSLLTKKIIKESIIQSKEFCLLKHGELIKVHTKSNDFNKIKQQINVKTDYRYIENVYSENKEKFKQDLDNILVKNFPCSKYLSVDEKLQKKNYKAKEILQLLKEDFKKAVTYDADGFLGIHRAVISNNLLDLQKHILILKGLKKNVDIPTIDNQTSLELAVEHEVSSLIVNILLDTAANPVSSKLIHDSAVILAAKKSSKILFLLLQYINERNKLFLDAKNSDGFAAIHYCAQRGNLKGVKELINHGAGVNIQDDRCGKTALFYALDIKNNDIPQKIYYQIASVLLEHGAIVNISTFSKHSVLSILDDVKDHSLKIKINKAVG